MIRLLALSLCFFAYFFQSAIAAPKCGEPYRIESGDSLSLIALLYYGDASQWRRLYEFGENKAIIGDNPGLMPVGRSIEMPACGGDEIQTATIERRAAVVAARPAPQNTPFVAPIEIVTGSNYTPFSGPELHNEGLATDIVRAAFAASKLPNALEISFVNDWESHLNQLIKRNKFTMGFPWKQPNCEKAARLPESVRIRCEYVFSEPLYFIAVKPYGPGAADTPRRWIDLAGSRICRPAGALEVDLSRHGLIGGENVTFTQSPDVIGCFRQLALLEVDYVVAAQFSAEAALAELKLAGVGPVRGVVAAETIHLVAHGDNAEAAYVWLERFNAGLDSIKRSGEWDLIVADHLDRFRASVGR